MNEQTRVQLNLLAQLAPALDRAGVLWWLFGGWAIDAHAGECTRDHFDIELFVRADDAVFVRDVLVDAGFVAPAPLHPDEGQPLVKDGQEIGVWFLVEDARGRTYTPGRWVDWPWRDGAFAGPRVRFAGLDLPVMSAEGLLDMKTGFAAHRYGSPLRDKDRADIELLRRIIERGAALR